MTPSEDHGLIELARRGDRAAVSKLLQANERRLYNVCLRMVRHRDDAAELTQDALLRIVEHLGDYRGEAKLTTWMTRIAMNGCLSFLRKRRLRHTVSLDTTGGNAREDDDRATLSRAVADHREPEPGSGVEQREQLEQMHAAIERLEPDHRAVLVLRDLEQMDYQQISEALDWPLGTVKSRLFRARLALRAAMQAGEASGVKRRRAGAT